MEGLELAEKATSGAMEFVFGGLFVVLFIYVLWEKRQSERRLMDHNERLANALQTAVKNLASMDSTIRAAVRDEIYAVLRWIQNGRGNKRED